jgi:hypothetical protein
VYKIWSNEHGGWWRPGGIGYTPDEDLAGVFHSNTALGVLIQSSLGSSPGEPKEVLVEQATGMRFHLGFHREESGKTA